MAPAAGFEPTPAPLDDATLVLKTSVLPLHYADSIYFKYIYSIIPSTTRKQREASATTIALFVWPLSLINLPHKNNISINCIKNNNIARSFILLAPLSVSYNFNVILFSLSFVWWPALIITIFNWIVVIYSIFLAVV